MKKFMILAVSINLISCESEVQESTDGSTFQSFLENFDPSGRGGDQNSAIDLSAESYARQLNEIQQQLAELSKMDTSELSFDDQIDWRFAYSILKGQEIRQSRHQSWKKDPRNYLQFRGLANVIGRPGDLSEKIEGLQERLSILPQQLKNGQKQTEVYVPRFQELGLFMAINARILFNEELPAFAQQNGAASQLTPLIQSAQEALEAYINYLEE